MATINIQFKSIGADAVSTSLSKFQASAVDVEKAIAELSESLGISVAEAKKLSIASATTDHELKNLASSLNLTDGEARQLASSMGLNAVATHELGQELGISAQEAIVLANSLANLSKDTNELASDQDAASNSALNMLETLEGLEELTGLLSGAQEALNEQIQAGIEQFAEFDFALAQIETKTGLTRDQLAGLSAEAERLAVVTTQSPASAIKAADALVGLGFSADEAQESLQGVLFATDALAGVGATTEKTAEVIGVAIGVYGKLGLTADEAADKITKLLNTTAAGKATGLDEINQLLSTSGALASNLGVGFDDLISTFASLRSAGQAPDVAATSMAGLLTSVLKNREELEKLGLSLYEVGENGTESFVGFTELSRQLSLSSQENKTLYKELSKDIINNRSELESLGFVLYEVGQNGQQSFVGLDNLAKQFNESQIGATEAVKLFGDTGVGSILTLQGTYGDLSETVNGISDATGTAASVIERQNDTLKGQFNLLTGSIEAAQGKFGQYLSDGLNPALQATRSLVDTFNSAPPIIQRLIVGVTAIASGLVTLATVATAGAVAFNALKAAKTGETLATLANSAAQTANTALIAANNIASADLITTTGKAVTALKIKAAASAADTTATTTAASANTALYSSLLPLAIALAGVVAAGKLVQSTWSAVRKEAANLEKSTQSVNDAFQQYNETTGKTLPEVVKTKGRLQELAQSAKEVASGFIEAYKNIEFFGTSINEASTSQTKIAFSDLLATLSGTNQEYANLAASNNLASESGAALLPVLVAQRDALRAAKLETEDELVLRAEEVRALNEKIAALELATGKQEEGTRAVVQSAKAYQELADALASSTGSIETDLLNAQTAAYQEFGDNKEVLEKKLFGIEQSSLIKRLDIQKKFLTDLNTATFENQDEKQAKIGEATQAVADLELQIAKEKSDRLIEQEEESLKLREEAEKAFAEKQEALAKQAYDRKKILLDQETNDLNQALDDRIAAENAAIEVLDDRSDLLNQELNLLNLLGDQSALIYAGREQDLNRQIEALGQQNQTIDQQIEKLKQTGASQSEIAALEERKILNANNILVLEEAKRVAAEEQLKVQQAIEQQQLLYQQELTRLDLDRQVRQAQINAIESEREVIQARQLAKSNELELSEQRRLFNLAKINEASEAEIIALQGQIDAATATLALSQESVGLAQQAAQLSKDEVTDAELARAKYEEISQVEAENLRLKQANERAQLANTNEASRTADQLARGAQEADELASSADGAASAIGGAADQGDRLTGSLGQARQEAGLLEQSLVAAGRALSDFQKQQLSEPLRNQTFDSSGKNTTLAKREIGGLGTQYFVGGKEVSESEYNAARKAEQDSKKTTRTYVTGANVTPEFFGDNPTSDSLKEFIRNSEGFVSAVNKVRSSGGRIQATEYVYQQAAANELAKELLPAILKQEAESLRNQEKKILGIELETAKIREQYAEVEKLDTLENENIVSRDRLTKLQLEDNAKDLEAARLALNNATIQQVNSNDAAAVQNREEAIVASENRIAELRLAKVKIISDALVALGYDINSSVPILTQSIQSRAGGGTLRIGGTAIEGRAVGGDVKRNQPYIVGERGRELFIPNQSGTIVPNSLLTAPTLPGSYSLSPTASTGGADSRALVLEIQGLRRDLANRPVPAVESNVTFVNEPNPLEAQIRLLQGQLRAGRSL